jgi:hypothetical protein
MAVWHRFEAPEKRSVMFQGGCVSFNFGYIANAVLSMDEIVEAMA